ncbi:hypothetical protein Lser_V15G21490 [Lactuca serriola]
MSFMGFDHKWSQWITACLVSSRTSILINKIPIKEFYPQRGLRQCDPLSPFLFILVMEGLHVAIEDDVNKCVFRGALIGDGGFVVSHIFYADDTLFLEEWDEQNIANLVTILNCFYLVSGLKLNLQKSNLLGIGVSFQQMEEMAVITGCAPASLPFSYLGLPVGANMNCVDNWNKVIQKFDKCLSSWKVNLISYGEKDLLG